MISRKAIAATGAATAAAVMFLGPVAVAGADTGSFSGSAELASGSADLTTGSAAGFGVLESGSGAIESGTSAILNIIESITGIKDLTAPAE